MKFILLLACCLLGACSQAENEEEMKEFHFGPGPDGEDKTPKPN